MPLPSHRKLLLANALVLTAMLTACSAPQPPRPPSVDESTAHAVNDPQQIEIIRLQNQLKNMRLLSISRPCLPQAASAASMSSPGRSNVVYVFNFDGEAVDVHPGPKTADEFVQVAKTGSYLVIRGRTDGTADTAINRRVARRRAENMRAFLIGMGVDPSRMRVTYQPSGDGIVAGNSPIARKVNRRVEVEVYSAPPKTVMLGSARGTPLNWEHDDGNQ